MKKLVRSNYLIISIVIATLIPFSIDIMFMEIVSAQEQPIQWSNPINLSNTSGDSTLPAIAADSWGYVHVFWLERHRDGPRPENWVPQRGDAIYYRQFDGNDWSESIDIFATADGTVFEFPFAVADQRGLVHLVWSGHRGLYYSSAHIAKAGDSAHSWLPSQLLGSGGPVEQPRIFLGNQDDLHIVYAATNLDGRIYHMRSDDGGNTWSTPTPVSEIPTNASRLHVSPRPSVDQAGRLHVAWFEAGPPNWAGDRVWYTYSNDRGNTWETSQILAEQASADEMQGTVSLTVVDADRLVAVWVCGQVTNRCTSQSTDGGITWEPAQRIFGQRQSRAGWDTITTDAKGHPYLIVQLRASDIPAAVYYSAFINGNWIDPPIPVITEGPLITAHHPQMTVAQGNQLHVVLEAYGESEIYYMTAITSAPMQDPPEQLPNLLQPVINDIAPPTSTPYDLATTLSTPPAFNMMEQPQTQSQSSEINSFVVTLLPALLLVLFVLSVQLIRKSR